jgi:DNA-binding MarR family transcriptional regulator
MSIPLSPPPLIGALLRVPAFAIHRQIISRLNSAGFTDLRVPHMAVFIYPGADGYRPSELAERAGMSKQAMNQLLQSMERLGYIRRDDGHGDGRARVVRFTQRGQDAWHKILEILADIESDWRATLGDQHFNLLKELLGEVCVSDLVTRC